MVSNLHIRKATSLLNTDMFKRDTNKPCKDPQKERLNATKKVTESCGLTWVHAEKLQHEKSIK